MEQKIKKKITHCNASKEEVIKYYLDENHSLAQTSRFFNCKPDAMKGFLERNNIFKESTRKKITHVKASKEEVIDYFISQNHTEIETATYFQCNITALENFLSRNNIKKGRRLSNILKSKVKANKRDNRHSSLLDRISKEQLLELLNNPLYGIKDIQSILNINYNDYIFLKNYYHISNFNKVFGEGTLKILNNYSKDFIYNYYVKQDHSILDCMNYFGVKRDSFLQALNYLNIDKVTHIEDIIKNIDETSFIEDLKSNYSLNFILNKYKINYFQLDPLIIKFNIDSKDILLKKGTIPENEFKQLLLNYNLTNFNTQFYLGNYRYDFKLDNNLIEINPSYSHNSSQGFRNLTPPLDRKYHYSKYKNALDNNYRCICIWDWDDKEKVIRLLLPKEKIYARKCTIKEVSREDAKSFINKYHLQNYSRDNVRIGLYYNDELISIMTFGKPRYNKNYQWELIRYCSSKNIVGGADKLFKWFIRNYSPLNIISYCDMSKFKGGTYLRLGFKFKNYSINKHWYNIENNIHITDNLLRQRGFDQLFKTNYGKGTSNEELMLKNGFVEIYDCGQSVYVWEVKNV